jgi:hypothetical protein
MAIDPVKKDAPKKIMVKKTTTVVDDGFGVTQKYMDTQKNMEKSVAKKASSDGTYHDKTQGITIEKESMKATPKKFLRKIIKTGDDRGMTKIMSDDGKSVKYVGRSNMTATKTALRENKSQSADTNARRENNANFYNVSSGAKKDLSEEDKNRLVDIRNAVRK